jgi:hypothetical protein
MTILSLSLDIQRKGHTISRATLALAIIAMVVCGQGGLVNVNRVGDGFAETVAGQRHFDIRK